MVRSWLGAGILIVFLILSLIAGMLMCNAHLPTSDLLLQAAEQTLNGNFNSAIPMALEAKHRWEDRWNGTAVVADHSPMDDVDALFSEMEIYAKTGEEPHFAACCQELAQRLQAVAEAHKFNWWNVL